MRKRQPNLYEVLGLSPNVSAREIKIAYRKLVKECHPDIEYKKQDEKQRSLAHQRMQSINEAYETLMDKNKRLDYDFKMGVGAGASARSRGVNGTGFPSTGTRFESDAEREKYLKKVFIPIRRSVVKALKEYGARLQDLSQDIYDDLLIEDFSTYVEKLEETLLKASNNYTAEECPDSLGPAVQWMRHSIAQAADGLEELNLFLVNFDYDHLAMAENLFKIAIEHSKVALNLTKV